MENKYSKPLSKIGSNPLVNNEIAMFFYDGNEARILAYNTLSDPILPTFIYFISSLDGFTISPITEINAIHLLENEDCAYEEINSLGSLE